jgi:hypothetical protein
MECCAAGSGNQLGSACCWLRGELRPPAHGLPKGPWHRDTYAPASLMTATPYSS